VGALFTFRTRPIAVPVVGQDQGRHAPAFPRKRATQLREASPARGVASLNLWASFEHSRIRAGQSQT